MAYGSLAFFMATRLPHTSRAKSQVFGDSSRGHSISVGPEAARATGSPGLKVRVAGHTTARRRRAKSQGICYRSEAGLPGWYRGTVGLFSKGKGQRADKSGVEGTKSVYVGVCWGGKGYMLGWGKAVRGGWGWPTFFRFEHSTIRLSLRRGSAPATP